MKYLVTIENYNTNWCNFKECSTPEEVSKFIEKFSGDTQYKVYEIKNDITNKF